MKIDNAAAAFRRAAENYTVAEIAQGDGEQSVFAVEEADGTFHETTTGREDDARALMQQLAGRDGVTAVLREMISPIVLTAAIDRAGLNLEKVGAPTPYTTGRKPSLALLLAIIDVLNAEAN